MVLMSNAYMLLQHARIFRTQETVLPRREPEISNSKNLLLVRIVLALTGAAVVTGTVVTGSGPHAGDENAIRIDLAINTAAKIHSVTVITCLVTALVLFLVARRDPISWRILAHPLERFLAIGFLQGLIGYVQYFSGLPVTLVAVHVALSVAVWLGALDLYWNSKLPKDA